MNIVGIIWLHSVINKLAQKHRVDQIEVEQVFHNHPQLRRIARGNVVGEDLFTAMGQTDSGRYLMIFFIYKMTHEALVISARDMDAKERKRHGKK